MLLIIMFGKERVTQRLIYRVIFRESPNPESGFLAQKRNVSWNGCTENPSRNEPYRKIIFHETHTDRAVCINKNP